MSRPGTPTPHDEANRLHTLNTSGLLDAPVGQRYERYVRIARSLTDAPIALVGLMDREQLCIRASHGLDATTLPRNETFCAHTILDDQPLIVTDARADKRFAGNALGTDAPGVRFYLGIPLTADNGSRIGTLAVMDTRTRSVDETALAGLADLADLLSGELAGLEQTSIDTETGLANRPGFEAIATQALATVQRLNRPSTLVVAGLYEARDRGAPVNPDDVRETANLLQGTFREADIYGRIREDKFCVLLTGAGAVDAIACLKRMEKALAARNAVAGPRRELALRFGMSTGRPSEHQSLQEMLAEAQASLETGSWFRRTGTR